MELPQADVSDICIFTKPLDETKAYYIKDRQQFDKFLSSLKGRFDYKSAYREAKELADADPSPFPCWVTVTGYDGVVFGAGLLNAELIEDMEFEYKAYVKSLREMIAHPENYEPQEVY